jgi:glycosyltransferase involved in cell wall biosynthesis
LVILRPINKSNIQKLSVSVVVAARNEAGNLETLVQRVPFMSGNDELILIEGGSSDNTWEVIQELQKKYADKIQIKIGQQDGKGKGDAVRKGFEIAEKDILMILDADVTVPPEDLVKFYHAIASDRGQFINGSRLVYPMEDKAMRFFNLIGNKFFANAFSFVLNQPLKDTLCGTKVLYRTDYLKIAKNRKYFGDFDPFGDFDLLLGAARMGLKIVELPIRYKARTYGDTNISRWKHGVILLQMLIFAARKIKFI